MPLKNDNFVLNYESHPCNYDSLFQSVSCPYRIKNFSIFYVLIEDTIFSLLIFSVGWLKSHITFCMRSMHADMSSSV